GRGSAWSVKATREMPSRTAVKVKELKIKVGDKVSQGSAILTLDAAEAKQEPAKPETPKREAPAAPLLKSVGGDVDCDVVVIGAGPGRYSAVFCAADLG